MLTENVSAHGARILTERKLERGQQVLVSAPKEDVHSQARIVYCQRVSEGWLRWVWNYLAGWSCGQSLTSRERPELLTLPRKPCRDFRLPRSFLIRPKFPH